MTITRQGKLNSIGPKLENAVKQGLIETAMVVAQRATEKAPRDTGRLKRSITNGLPYDTRPGGWAIDVGTNVEYAAIQEFGGTIDLPRIYPKTKQALAFDWPNAPAGLKPSKGGKYVFKSVAGHSVTIPAQPYLRPALRESEPVVKQLLVKNILAAFR